MIALVQEQQTNYLENKEKWDAYLQRKKKGLFSSKNSYDSAEGSPKL